MLKKRSFRCIFFTLVLLMTSLVGSGSTPYQNDDVFSPICKYIAQGDAERLSAWFSPSLEIGILSPDSPTSKAQACQIMKTFFKNYPPRSFTISHKAAKGGGKYAIGTLNAGGERFIVTIFTAYDSERGAFCIQQISIGR